MHNLARTIAAIGLAALPGAAPCAEEAPPRVIGDNCNLLTASLGPDKVWRTWFRGEQSDTSDGYVAFWAAPCFTSREDCKAWLYWAQSDYPYQTVFTPCRRIGY